MTTLLVFLICCCIFFILSVESYDFLVLSLLWPRTYCRPPVKCKSDQFIPQAFTINGLWPVNSSPPLPRFCGAGNLTAKMIKPIKYELEYYWPTFKLGEDNFDYWDRQWQEHGTCSHFKQFPYFELAVQRKRAAYLQDGFEQHGVVPSHTELQDTKYFFNITSNFAKRPQLICSRSSPPELKEIRLCMEKNEAIDFIDCPFVYKTKGCGNSFRWPLI